MKKTLLSLVALIFLFFFVQKVNGQAKTVKGSVKNEDGELLEGITVSGPDSEHSVKTNNLGFYEITVEIGDGFLLFSGVGYDKVQASVPASNILDVIMVESQKVLEEVVVVGYGTQSRRTITSAITKIGGEEIQGIPISTIGEGLKGKVSGARVYQSNNTPGADAIFR